MYRVFKSLALLGCILTMLGACSDDNINQPKSLSPTEVKSLKLDVDTIKMQVGEASDVKIVEGNGSYRVFSENPEIATASVEGDKLHVEAKMSGMVSLVLSDAQGLYKRFPVVAIHGKILLEKDAVVNTIKLGHLGKAQYVKILAANGDCAAESDKPEVVSVEYVRDGIIAYTPRNAGEAVLTITDEMDLKTTLRVTVETTTAMYTAEEKQEIANKANQAFDFNGTDFTRFLEYSRPRFNIADGRVNFSFVQGRSPYGVSFAISFTGDLTEGVKANGQVDFIPYGTMALTKLPNATVEIIKVTPEKIWLIFSDVVNGRLHGGYLIVDKPQSGR